MLLGLWSRFVHDWGCRSRGGYWPECAGRAHGMARNPDTYGNLLTNMILGIAFSEAIAIYCLVIAFLMLFKVV